MERTLSISAIVIALCALAVSIWQGHLARVHNEMSVQPRLNIAASLNSTNGVAEINLTNAGLGPAIIRGTALYHKDTHLGPGSGAEWWRAVELIGISWDGSIFYTSYGTDQTIAAGEVDTVLSFSGTPTEDLVNLLRVGLTESVRFEVCYCSGYGVCEKLALKEMGMERTVSSCEEFVPQNPQ